MNFLVYDKDHENEFKSITQRKTMYAQSLSRKTEIQSENNKIKLKLSDITGAMIKKSILKKDRQKSLGNSTTMNNSTYQKKVSIRLPILNNFVKKPSKLQKVRTADRLSSILSKHEVHLF